MHDKHALGFDVLSDTDLEAIRAYGLAHHDPYHDLDVALPANVLIDRDGKIAWMRVSTMIQDRIDPDQLLETVRKYGL